MLVHDMRAPLDGIKLTLGVLRRQEQLGTPRWELMDQALGSLEDVHRLMDELLHANRLEDETFQPGAHPLALGALLERSLRTFRPMAEERGLALLVAGMDELPPVMADTAVLKRVLDNLIGNALKFTEAGSVRVSAERAGGALKVMIADTGPGIPADARARVFDRYYHVERRKTNRQGGFGLGLAFCEKAVAAMGGRIGVDERPGGGSIFWFTLPEAAEATAERA
jgi:signal transduction histidine kinase